MKAEGKKVKSNLKESLDRSRHFVSEETEQHKPVPIDLDHSVLNEASIGEGDGRVEGVGETNHSEQSLQHTRKHEVLADPAKGGEDARETKKSSRVTLGRHITSDDGLDVAARRSKFLADTKKANERAHESRRQSSSTT
jgi:hypothetical protein